MLWAVVSQQGHQNRLSVHNNCEIPYPPCRGVVNHFSCPGRVVPRNGQVKAAWSGPHAPNEEEEKEKKGQKCLPCCIIMSP